MHLEANAHSSIILPTYKLDSRYFISLIFSLSKKKTIPPKDPSCTGKARKEGEKWEPCLDMGWMARAPWGDAE